MSNHSVAEDSGESQSRGVNQTPDPQRDQLILDPEVLFNSINHWKAEGYHVLTPATRVQRFAPQWGASISMVLMDPTVDYDTGRGTDCYFDPGTMKRPGADVERHERGIARVGLARIARCAGISWDPTFTVRVDSRQMLHFWEFRAVGVGMDFDGQPFTIQGTKEVDLRDESAQIGGWSPKVWRDELDAAQREKRGPKAINGWTDRRVLGARAHGLQLAETKAMDRAIRSLGLQHIYTVAQLRKPFIVVKATYVPDMADPDVRAMVTEQHLRGTRALFAPSITRPIPVIDITTREPRALPEAPSDSDAPPREMAPAREVVPARPTVPSLPPTAPQPATPPAAVPPPQYAAPSAPPPIARVTPTTPGANAPGWRRHVAVLNVDTLKSGSTARGDWSLTKITLGIGESTTESYTTLDSGVAAAARQHRETGALADVNVQKDEQDKYLNVIEVLPAGQQQGLPGILANELPPTTPPKSVDVRDIKW
jgi:hypothetical protein